jgi:hypothetical protein
VIIAGAVVGGMLLGAVILVVVARVMSARRSRKDSILRAVLDINTMLIEARSRFVETALNSRRRQTR